MIQYKKRTLQFLGIFLICTIFQCHSQTSHCKDNMICIAFYNVENIFDTIDNPQTNDQNFLPESSYQWNSEKYYKKIQNISSAIATIGQKETQNAPILIGLAEIENKNVLEDLINSPQLKKYNYGIVHFDSQDPRGIDVGLLYQKDRFKIFDSSVARTVVNSRDQLLVSGILDKEDSLFILINHWTSRISGTQKSEPKRIASAQLARRTCDSLCQKHPNAKIIIMGDFNDNPSDISISQYLEAEGDTNKINTSCQLYNPMYVLAQNGKGSSVYQKQWNLYDQIIISGNLLYKNKNGLHFVTAAIFDDEMLKQKKENYQDYPQRTITSNAYYGGYSDHFPVYITLKK